jgi:hypothetical protein
MVAGEDHLVVVLVGARPVLDLVDRLECRRLLETVPESQVVCGAGKQVAEQEPAHEEDPDDRDTDADVPDKPAHEASLETRACARTLTR